eukprot:GHVU01089220.1.p1 GENE.GHVU01089220.1~~GHVU01089220.1.p1  ORF type:complete len:258 (+),score=47.20 GHVU01089220.1:1011-1784(+)
MQSGGGRPAELSLPTVKARDDELPDAYDDSGSPANSGGGASDIPQSASNFSPTARALRPAAQAPAHLLSRQNTTGLPPLLFGSHKDPHRAEEAEHSRMRRSGNNSASGGGGGGGGESAQATRGPPGSKTHNGSGSGWGGGTGCPFIPEEEGEGECYCGSIECAACRHRLPKFDPRRRLSDDAQHSAVSRWRLLVGLSLALLPVALWLRRRQQPTTGTGPRSAGSLLDLAARTFDEGVKASRCLGAALMGGGSLLSES